MLRNSAKFMLFLQAYIPLFLILLIKYFDNEIIRYAMIVLVTGLIAYTITLLNRITKKNGKFIGEIKVENINRVGLEYFITYIIPFLQFDLLSIGDYLSIIILFIVMGTIYIKSDLIYINPMLAFFGYNIFKTVKTEDNEEVVIITKGKKKDIENNPKLIPLGESVFIDSKSYKS